MIIGAIQKSIRGIFFAAATACCSISLINQWQVAHHQIQQDEVHPIIVPSVGTIISPYTTYLSWERAEHPIKYDLGDPSIITGIAKYTPDAIKDEMKWSLTILGFPGAALGNVCGSVTGYIARDHEWRPKPAQHRFK